jgi:hypothetical protein
VVGCGGEGPTPLVNQPRWGTRYLDKSLYTISGKTKDNVRSLAALRKPPTRSVVVYIIKVLSSTTEMYTFWQNLSIIDCGDKSFPGLIVNIKTTGLGSWNNQIIRVSVMNWDQVFILAIFQKM